MGNRIDLTGKRFGKITVISFEYQKMPSYSLYWLCECDCGNKKIINGHSLKTGFQKSCGCERDKNKFIKTHGLIKSYEYRCWLGMKARCKNSDGKHNTYIKNNITICDEWDSSFELFYAEMGKAPTLKHTIDRIDNLKGYCKENCRWATHKEQCVNKSTNKILEFGGKRLCQSQWTELLGFKENTIHNRLKCGWSISKALTTPVRKRNQPKKKVQSALCRIP